MSYGIKISKIGESAESTDPRNIILTTEKPVLKIEDVYSGTATILAASNYVEVDIDHNLGYKALFQIWASKTTGDSDYTLMDSREDFLSAGDYAFETDSDDNTLTLHFERDSNTPAGDVDICYHCILFIDPDYSIAGVGDNPFSGAFGINISKEGIDLSGDYDEDDLVYSSTYETLRISEIHTGTLSTGDKTISHGLTNSIPTYLTFFEDNHFGQNEWHLFNGTPRGPKGVAPTSKVDLSNIVLTSPSTYNGKKYAVAQMDNLISGDGNSYEGSDIGLVISKDTVNLSNTLLEKNLHFSSKKQTLQPYETIEFESAFDSSPVAHSMGFPPLFTAMVQLVVVGFDFGWTPAPYTLGLGEYTEISVDADYVYIRIFSPLPQTSVKVKVMLYPIDISV